MCFWVAHLINRSRHGVHPFSVIQAMKISEGLFFFIMSYKLGVRLDSQMKNMKNTAKEYTKYSSQEGG